MNLARALGVSAKVASHTIVEAHADSDQQVGFLNGVIDPGFAVHAHHSEIQRIAGREAADAEKRHGNIKVAGANKSVKCFHRTGNHNAVSGENKRALGGVQKFDCAVEFSFVYAWANALWREL